MELYISVETYTRAVATRIGNIGWIRWPPLRNKYHSHRPNKIQETAEVIRDHSITGLDQLQTKEPACCMAKTRSIDPTASRALPRKSILETEVNTPYLLRRSSGHKA